jgi:hypothetical protein
MTGLVLYFFAMNSGMFKICSAMASGIGSVAVSYLTSPSPKTPAIPEFISAITSSLSCGLLQKVSSKESNTLYSRCFWVRTLKRLILQTV